MNADELAKAVRRGDEKLRADDLVVETGTERLTGKGYLLVRPTALIILMTLDAGAGSLGQGRSGVVTTSDYWTMTGTIDHDLKFRCKCGPVPTQHYRNGACTLEESVSPIELEIKGWDTLTTQERRKKWEELHALFPTPSADADFYTAEAGRLADGSFEFQANFVDHELRFKNEVTHTERKNAFFGNEGSGWKTDTLLGETSTYKFAFIQEDDSNDLRLVIRSKENQPPLSEAAHLRKYESLGHALAFVHGINAWPYRLCYWRSGSKSSEKLFPATAAPRTHHTPFSGLGHDVSMGGFLAKVAEFLEPDTSFNDKLTSQMYLFRQAGAAQGLRKVDTLALCAILEGLTKLLFDEFGLAAPQNVGQFADFEARKDELLAFVDGLANPSDSTRRLRQAVSSAQPTRPLKIEEKFEMVCKRLGLQWDGKMQVVKDAWWQVRNDFAPGDFREGATITEEVFKADTLAESRIAGGFNTILLKLFEYSGLYTPSAFEAGHDTL